VLPPPIRVTIVAASLCSAWPTLLSGVDRKVRSMMGSGEVGSSKLTARA
jgi:hypothetical protein